MVALLPDAMRLDRADCRSAAECRFSLDLMTADYERLYHAVLRGYGRIREPDRAEVRP
jgi:hypothetical protein